jgi:amidase
MNPREPHLVGSEIARQSAAGLRALMDAGTTTSAEVTAALLGRIEAIDRGGPRLRAVLSVNDRALDEAAVLDTERRAGHTRGPLHGIPILIKDNIDTAGTLGTTAGSLALSGPPPAVDARLVAQLREAGAIILGKTNLSEWANFRGRPSSSGWSAAGGQTRNPFALDRTPGGSSSGSAAGVVAGLAPIAIGTATDGSILCPSAACGIVGLKPTVGLVSRTGIVPISSSQDTAGPMARSVADAALLLDALTAAPADPADPAMAARPHAPGGYLAALDGDLRGFRIGVARDERYFGYHSGMDRAVEAMLGAFAEAGAELVDPVTGIGMVSHVDEMIVLCTEFKAGLAAYLARRWSTATDAAGLPRSLEDVVAFNEATGEELLSVFPQDVLLRSAESGGLDEPAYLEALAANHRRSRDDGIDAVCRREALDALVAPTMVPAWLIDYVDGDHHAGAAWDQAAIAGYPSISLPVGEFQGLPVGLTIWGRAWTEATLLNIAFALERQIGFSPVATFRESVGSVPS